MRRLPILLLLASLSLPLFAQAQEIQESPEVEAADTLAQAESDNQQEALTAQLAESEQQRRQLLERLNSQRDAQQMDQVARLNEQVTELRQQLRQLQEQKPQVSFLTEQQVWYAIGAGSVLIAVLLGALLRGGKGRRREWVN